jgi:hypothetical protein
MHIIKKNNFLHCTMAVSGLHTFGNSYNRDVHHFHESGDPEQPPWIPDQARNDVNGELSMTRYSIKYHNTFKGGVNTRKKFTAIPQGKTHWKLMITLPFGLSWLSVRPDVMNAL